jgi:tryptophan synthase beta chain
VEDADAVAALKLCTRLEGILPALEPSHALHLAGQLEGRVLVCLSGRGDKDLDNLGA